MKITGVRTTVLKPERKDVRGGNNYRNTSLLVEISTDAGLTGLSLCSAALQSAVEKMVSDLLTGQDPRRAPGLMQLMTDSPGDEGTQVSALSAAALDNALWDLKAKANDEPLWKTLGGHRPRANVHVGGFALKLSDEALVEHYRNIMEEYGSRSIKVAAGADQNANIRRLDLLITESRRYGSAPELAIDTGAICSQDASSDEVISKITEIESLFDTSWIEGAVPCGDARGISTVSDRIRSAVSAGRSLKTFDDFRPLFEHHAPDIFELDISLIGITTALQLSDAAFGLELPVILSAATGNWQAHLSSSLPYFMSTEISLESLPAGIGGSDVSIVDGWGVAGDAPGHGLTLECRQPDGVAEQSVDGNPI